MRGGDGRLLAAETWETSSRPGGPRLGAPVITDPWGKYPQAQSSEVPGPAPPQQPHSCERPGCPVLCTSSGPFGLNVVPLGLCALFAAAEPREMSAARVSGGGPRHSEHPLPWRPQLPSEGHPLQLPDMSVFVPYMLALLCLFLPHHIASGGDHSPAQGHGWARARLRCPESPLGVNGTTCLDLEAGESPARPNGRSPDHPECLLIGNRGVSDHTFGHPEVTFLQEGRCSCPCSISCSLYSPQTIQDLYDRGILFAFLLNNCLLSSLGGSQVGYFLWHQRQGPGEGEVWGRGGEASNYCQK